MRKSITPLLIWVFVTAAGIFIWYEVFDESTYCGKIKYKVTDMEYRKHYASTVPLLVVQFDNGITEDKHVSYDTFLSNEVGDRMCFSEPRCEMHDSYILDRKSSPVLSVIIILLGTACLVVGILCIVYNIFKIIYGDTLV